MKNNWPETIGELLEECQQLISKNDLYTLGERGEPFSGETEPRVDGTEYLAGEYQYGVAMIPAQWVTHVIETATLSGGKLTAEQVREAVMSADRWEKPMGDTGLTNTHLIIRDDGWQAIADELNARAERACEPEWTLQGKTQTQEFWRCECGNCGHWFGAEDRRAAPFKVTIDKVEIPNFCPNCGRKVKR